MSPATAYSGPIQYVHGKNKRGERVSLERREDGTFRDRRDPTIAYVRHVASFKTRFNYSQEDRDLLATILGSVPRVVRADYVQKGEPRNHESRVEQYEIHLGDRVVASMMHSFQAKTSFANLLLDPPFVVATMPHWGGEMLFEFGRWEVSLSETMGCQARVRSLVNPDEPKFTLPMVALSLPAMFGLDPEMLETAFAYTLTLPSETARTQAYAWLKTTTLSPSGVRLRALTLRSVQEEWG